MQTNKFRSHNCGELTVKNIENNVKLSGWVHTKRDHGGVVFFNMRDRYGITQVVCDTTQMPELAESAKNLHHEYLVEVQGVVKNRPDDAINKNMVTGEIEIVANKIEILNKCKRLPFEINTDDVINDQMLLKYRYLHLRRPKPQSIIIQRYKVTKAVRDFFHKEGFLELETPLLTKTTPEGARDFLVPSRLYPGTFYALPQSPQQYKELIMVAGFDKYFQIARAMRDEDPRIDRQAEHTQIDMEMSFVERDDVIDVIERLITEVTENHSDKKLLFKPFPKISYEEAMEKYGSDKPDLRFEMEIKNITDQVKDCNFRVFTGAIENKGEVRGITVTGCGNYSRKQLNEVIEIGKEYGLKGLVWIIPGKEKIRSSTGKNLSEEELKNIVSVMEAKENDLILLAADQKKAVLLALGQLRLIFGDRLNLRNPNIAAFAFIVDFPMFKWDEKGKRYDPLHHMFVKPKDGYTEFLDTDPLKVIGTQFDLVCNGYEMCSGSIRNHTRELQEKIMKLIGLSSEEIEAKFAHLLEAFDYGAPPHGGAAPGLDRLLMVLTATPNMRDVVVFPKTQSGKDLLMGGPSLASEEQLKELFLKLDYESMKPEWKEYLENEKSFEQRTF